MTRGRNSRVRARPVGTAAVIALVALAPVVPARAAGTPGGAEIGGTVEDAAGRPIAGADVVVARPDGSARRTAITDDDGGFALITADSGPVQVLVVTGRGAKVATAQLVLAPGARIRLTVSEGHLATLAITNQQVGFVAPRVIALGESLALARDRDLAGALVGLPGTTPAVAPAGGPVVGGLLAAEIPVFFEGFLLNDPVDGGAPLDLPVSLFSALAVERGPAVSLSLVAARPQGGAARLNSGGSFAGSARGADGAARPTGSTTGWLGHGGIDLHSAGRARATLALAPQQNTWESDPESAAAPRGRRRRVLPLLAWGELDAAGWQIGAGGLASFTQVDRGRSDRLLPAGEPTGTDRSWLLLGTTARRQLGTGSNDVALRVGVLRTGQALATVESNGRAAVDTTATRVSLGAGLHLSGRWGLRHRLQVASGLDLERAERSGEQPSRQAGTLIASAEAHGLLPWIRARRLAGALRVTRARAGAAPGRGILRRAHPVPGPARPDPPVFQRPVAGAAGPVAVAATAA